MQQGVGVGVGDIPCLSNVYVHPVLIVKQPYSRYALARDHQSQNASRAGHGALHHSAPPRTEHIVARLAWSSLRASMVVLLSSVVCNMDMLMGAETLLRHPALLRASYLLLSVQHMYSPLVYLLFFPDFRRVAFRWCGWMKKKFWPRSAVSASDAMPPIAVSVLWTFLSEPSFLKIPDMSLGDNKWTWNNTGQWLVVALWMLRIEVNWSLP